MNMNSEELDSINNSNLNNNNNNNSDPNIKKEELQSNGQSVEENYVEQKDNKERSEETSELENGAEAGESALPDTTITSTGDTEDQNDNETSRKDRHGG